MAPPLVTTKFFVPVKVIAGNEIPAFASVTVKLDPPLIAPPKVITPEPVPPMVVSLPRLIGLFNVIVEPDNVNAPVPLPTLFNVMVFAFVKVALLKLISSAAPLATVVPLDVPNAPMLFKRKIPAFIAVAPEYVFALDNIHVPVPVLVSVPVVVAITPLSVPVPLPVKLRLNVLPVMPPLTFAMESKLKVPALTVVIPVYELEPVKASVPLPNLVKPTAPVIGNEMDKSSVAVPSAIVKLRVAAPNANEPEPDGTIVAPTVPKPFLLRVTSPSKVNTPVAVLTLAPAVPPLYKLDR